MIFIGFGTKAAIFPLGDWLPDAHPAAPSPISCLLSGVMIKLGVYGILRIFFWMAPSAHTYTIWGGVIAFLGACSLFVGTMEALAQHDSKRLLAFHSMGQMGYIFLGIGIGIAFLRISPALSAAGFIGGLYHLVNHACFKGLLFLNAGSALDPCGHAGARSPGRAWPVHAADRGDGDHRLLRDRGGAAAQRVRRASG